MVMDDFIACRIFRPQHLLRPAFVVVDDGVGGVQNGLRRAVVLFQLDRRRVGIVPRKVDDIADVRAAPCVNALIRVADDADVSPFLGQQLRQRVLGVVRILVFVDEDILKAVLVFFPHVFVLLQQAHGQAQQVVEVHSVVFLQLLFIQRIYLGDFLGVEIAGPAGKFIGVHQGVLRRRNRPQDGPGRKLLVIQIDLLQAILNEGHLVCRIVNRKISGIAEAAVDFKAQQFGAERMEGADPHAFSPRADQLFHSFPHFLGRLIGEGNRQDGIGRHTLLQQVGNAAGQYLRLPRPGTGRDEQRPFGQLHRFELPVVQCI